MSDRLTKVREFAENMGCTPQNIYLHLKKYAQELEGHVIDSRQGKLLDEYACEFLRGVMYPRELDGNSEVTRLNEELNELRAAFMRLGQENLRLSSELMETRGELDRSLIDNKQFQKLLQAAEDAEEVRQEELREAKEKAEKEALRADAAETRAGEAEAKIEELENRSRWQRFKDVFR